MAEKILVVDDEVDTLRLVGLMLERQGYEISTAENGKEAVEAVNKEIPDLILLDVMMPDMDGFEVARQIRSKPETENIPIIMFTAKVQVEDKIEGLESGADVYLTKPTQPRELFAQVKVLLARSKKSLTQPLPKGSEKGYLIGILAAKGGLGVSSMAVNLGISLYRTTEKEVLVADFRPGASDISVDLGFLASEGIDRLLEKELSSITPAAIQKELITHSTGIRLLLSSNQPAAMLKMIAVDPFKRITSHLPYLSRFTIIDLGPSLPVVTQAIAEMFDELIVLVEPSPTNLKQTKALVQDLYNLGVGEGRIRFVLYNRVRSSLQMTWQQVEDNMGRKMATVITPAPELAYQASATNQPMVVQQPNSITAQQFQKLGTTIAQQVIRS